MATLAELTTPLTVDEVSQSIYDSLAALGVKTTSWKPGAVARTIIAGASIVLQAFSVLQAEIAKVGFLELSSGDWLAVVALQVYGVTKTTGTFAAGNLTLSNTAGGVFAPGVGDVIALNTATGKTYRNTVAFTIAAFETGVIVAFEAIEIGSDSTSPIGDIDALETVLLGVTVTNAAALVGEDAETDAALRTRSLAKTGPLSPNGPSDAYRFLSLSAKTDDGTPAGVTRVTTVPDGEGNVIVYVATASGPVTGSLGDTTTPLGAVDDDIQTLAVPLAVTATTTSAIANAVVVKYTIWLRSTIGLTEPEITALIATSLTNFMASQPIGGSRKVPGGGFVFTDAIEAAIASAVGTTSLIDIDLTTPAADVVIAANEAPAIGTITPTVILIAI